MALRRVPSHRRDSFYPHSPTHQRASVPEGPAAPTERRLAVVNARIAATDLERLMSPSRTCVIMLSPREPRAHPRVLPSPQPNLRPRSQFSVGADASAGGWRAQSGAPPAHAGTRGRPMTAPGARDLSLTRATAHSVHAAREAKRATEQLKHERGQLGAAMQVAAGTVPRARARRRKRDSFVRASRLELPGPEHAASGSSATYAPPSGRASRSAPRRMRSPDARGQHEHADFRGEGVDASDALPPTPCNGARQKWPLWGAGAGRGIVESPRRHPRLARAADPARRAGRPCATPTRASSGTLGCRAARSRRRGAASVRLDAGLSATQAMCARVFRRVRRAG